MNTPHPELETLAELADPAADPAEPVGAEDVATAQVLAHVADCPTCQADLATLRVVRETLRRLPPVPMPADVADRIEAALVAARASDSRPADVVPINSRAAGQPRQRNPFPYGAAAAVVAILAVGGLVFGLTKLGGESKKSATSAAASSSGPLLIASGTDYTDNSLRAQVAALVNGRVPAAAANFPGLANPNVLTQGAAAGPSAPAAAGSSAASTASTFAAAPTPSASASAADGAGSVAGQPGPRRTAPSGPLADLAALRACITTLLGKNEQPVLVDYANYNGVPSTILVLPDPDVGNKLDVYVEADSANCANQELTAVAFLPAAAAS